MGGAPYTSLGCVNCRKRKIKCDLEKPECRRCEIHGIRCLGYDQGRNFLPHTLEAKRTSTGEVLRPVRYNVTHLKPLALPSFFTMSMSAEIRTQLFANFMGDFFVPNAKAKHDSMYFLMAQFPIRAGQSELLDRSVMALVAAFLGRVNQDKALVIQGMRLYNTALNVMRYTLQRKRSSQDQQEGANMLCSTLILDTYEFMHSNGDALQGYLAHVKGAVAIMKQYNLTGRDADKLTKAIHMRQKWAAAFFILNPEYGPEMELDCLFLGQEDSIEDSLLGILAECALLQRLLEAIASSQGLNREESYKELLRRCFQVQAKLGDFLDDSSHIKALEDKPMPCDKSELASEPRLQWLNADLRPYRFQDPKAARIYILFWVAMIVTGRIVYQTQLVLSRETNTTCALFYASEICRCVAYWMQPERSISFSGPMLLALSQTSKCFILCGMQREFLWCQGVYSFVKQNGYDIVSFVSEQERALWNRTWEGRILVMDREKPHAKVENTPNSFSTSSVLPARNPCH